MDGGGAERLNIALAKSLGGDILLLEGKMDYAVSEQSVITLFPFFKLIPSWLKWLFTPIYMLALAMHLKPEDVVVSSLDRAIFVSAMTKFLFKKHQAIAWSHIDPSFTNTTFFASAKRSLMRFLYQKVDHLIVNSKGAKEKLKDLVGAKNITWIPNALPIEEIFEQATLNTSIVKKENEEIWMVLASINERKGHRSFLKVIKQIKDCIPKVKIWLVGTGDLENELKDFCKQEGLNEIVSFLGFQKNPFPYLRQADLLIHPSHVEGFGNVLVEALALGVPVMCADVDFGPREILAPSSNFQQRTEHPEFVEFGILMPTFGGPEARKNTVLELWEETLLRLPSLSRKMATYRKIGPIRAKHFDQEEIIKQWKKIITPFFGRKPDRA